MQPILQGFPQSVIKGASPVRLILYFLGAGIIVVLLIYLFLHNHSSSSNNGPLLKQITALEKDLTQLKKEKSIDSLDKIKILSSIDLLLAQRDYIYGKLSSQDQVIRNIKSEYEKISNRYTGLSRDSLRRLFSEKFH